MDVRLSVVSSFGGKQFVQNNVLTGTLAPLAEANLAPAKTGTLSARTDNDTGTLTMDVGHGFVTGNRLDVYWTEAGVRKSRRGMIAGTVAVNSVPIDLGAGDNLPVVATQITAMVPTAVPITFVGNNAQLLVVQSQRGGSSVVFTLADDTLVYGMTLKTAGDVFYWYTTSGVANPFAGVNVAKVHLSHGDYQNSGIVRAGVLHN